MGDVSCAPPKQQLFNVNICFDPARSVAKQHRRPQPQSLRTQQEVPVEEFQSFQSGAMGGDAVFGHYTPKRTPLSKRATVAGRFSVSRHHRTPNDRSRFTAAVVGDMMGMLQTDATRQKVSF